jgi:hypothetical protein
MSKLLFILLIGLVFEAAGVMFLKKGLTKVGDIQKISISEIVRVIKSGITSPQILLGVFFEALFFGQRRRKFRLASDRAQFCDDYFRRVVLSG